jgi:hypothetical protein
MYSTEEQSGLELSSCTEKLTRCMIKCVADASKYAAMCLFADGVQDPKEKLLVGVIMGSKDQSGRLQQYEALCNTMHDCGSFAIDLSASREHGYRDCSQYDSEFLVGYLPVRPRGNAHFMPSNASWKALVNE